MPMTQKHLKKGRWHPLKNSWARIQNLIRKRSRYKARMFWITWGLTKPSPKYLKRLRTRHSNRGRQGIEKANWSNKVQTISSICSLLRTHYRLVQYRKRKVNSSPTSKQLLRTPLLAKWSTRTPSSVIVLNKELVMQRVTNTSEQRRLLCKKWSWNRLWPI